MATPARILMVEGDTVPPVPTNGQILFYAKTNGGFYSLNSAGVETPLGGAPVIDTLGELNNVSPTADNLNNTSDIGKVLMWNGTVWIPAFANSATILVDTISQRDALTVPFGTQVHVANSSDGSGNNVDMWSLWIFLPAGWQLLTRQESAESDSSTLEATITYGSSISVIGALPTLGRITLITVEVTQAFNGNPSLDIFYTVGANSSIIMNAGLIDLTVADTYSTTTDVVFGIDTPTGDITISSILTPNGATTGQAQIIVSYV